MTFSRITDAEWQVLLEFKNDGKAVVTNSGELFKVTDTSEAFGVARNRLSTTLPTIMTMVAKKLLSISAHPTMERAIVGITQQGLDELRRCGVDGLHTGAAERDAEAMGGAA
jgi:hypothetical protein